MKRTIWSVIVIAVVVFYPMMIGSTSSAQTTGERDFSKVQVFDTIGEVYELGTVSWLFQTHSPVDLNGRDLAEADRYVVERVVFPLYSARGYLLYRTRNATNLQTTRVWFIPHNYSQSGGWVDTYSYNLIWPGSGQWFLYPLANGGYVQISDPWDTRKTSFLKIVGLDPSMDTLNSRGRKAIRYSHGWRIDHTVQLPN